MNNIFGIMLLCLISAALSCAVSIFTMLAIGNDARAIGFKKRTLMMVLSFFFPFVIAIVYLCVRKKADKIQPKLCNNCRTTVHTSTKICPNCASTSFSDYLIPNNEQYHKKAKSFAIVAIIFYVVNIIFNSLYSDKIDNYFDKFVKDKIPYSEFYDFDYDDSDENSQDDLESFFDSFGE